MASVFRRNTHLTPNLLRNEPCFWISPFFLFDEIHCFLTNRLGFNEEITNSDEPYTAIITDQS